jgi:uncharacterized RDD family membrane protein YckC
MQTMYLINKIIDFLPKRIISAIVDLFSLTLASMILSVIEVFTLTPPVYTAIVLFSVFLNKDIYYGKSIGKYFNGTRVVSIKTGSVASPIQCLIRNLFILIWPLETIVLFFTPERRIGDMVAGTKVQENVEIGQEMKWQYVQAIISIVTSVTLVYSLFTYIDSLGFMN